MDAYVGRAKRGAVVLRDYSLQALLCSGKYGKRFAANRMSALFTTLRNWRNSRLEEKVENDSAFDVNVYEFLGCQWLLEDIYTLAMMWFTTVIYLALHVLGIHPASFAIALGTLWTILKCDDVLIPALQESVQNAEYGRHTQLFVDELIDRKILFERIVDFFRSGIDYLRSVSSAGFACLTLLIGLFILRLGQTFGFGLLLYSCSIMFCLLPYINRVVRASTESLWQALEQAEESATKAESFDDYLPATSTASVGTGSATMDEQEDVSERSEFERQLDLHGTMVVPKKMTTTTVQSVDKFNSTQDFLPYSTMTLFADSSKNRKNEPVSVESLASTQPPIQLLGKPISGLNFLMSHFSTAKDNKTNNTNRDADTDAENDDDDDYDADSDDKENAGGSERSFYKASSSAAERLREQNRRQIEQQFVVPSAPPDQQVDEENLQQKSQQQKVARRKKVLQPTISSASDDTSISSNATDEDFEVIDALDETNADVYYPRLSTFGDYDALLARQSPTPNKLPETRNTQPSPTAAAASERSASSASSPRPSQWLWG